MCRCGDKNGATIERSAPDTPLQRDGWLSPGYIQLKGHCSNMTALGNGTKLHGGARRVSRLTPG